VARAFLRLTIRAPERQAFPMTGRISERIAGRSK
jgi:hypothetical protein